MCGAWLLCTLAIMGDDEPIDPRLDDSRLRIRRKRRKRRIQKVTRARNPSTVMTAMAQCGKEEPPLPDWRPDELEGDECKLDKEAAAADDDAAAAEAVDDIDETTQSAIVVSSHKSQLGRIKGYVEWILTNCSEGRLWNLRAV